MTRYPDAFIHDIPKSDLHVHLDGSLRLSSLIDMAKRGNVELPSYSEASTKTTTRTSLNTCGASNIPVLSCAIRRTSSKPRTN